jgi:hypothetical protein
MVKDAQTSATVADIGLPIGVAAIATGAVVVLTSRASNAKTNQTVRVQAVTGIRAAGFALSGSLW